MKRLNPVTNQEFKYGDVRDDGRVFIKYMYNKLKKDGFYQEQWLKPSSFAKVSSYSVKSQAKRRTTAKGRAEFLINSARRRVANTKAAVTVSIETLVQTIEKGKCQLTGLAFDLTPSTATRINPYAPSLDRINPKDKNYSEENTRVVLAAVNSALGEFGEEAILPILKAMVKSIERKIK